MSSAASAVRVGIVALGAVLTMFAASGPARADTAGSLLTLVDAAAQRLQTADAVAASKWTTRGSIEDPVRERQVIEAVTADAKSRGVDPAYVEAAFRDQIAATVAVEYARFSDWTLDPDNAPTTAPDLSDSRTAIDALNKTMVAEIAGQWDSLHDASCAGNLEAARNAVAVARGLDDLYRRALAFATRSYCR